MNRPPRRTLIRHALLTAVVLAGGLPGLVGCENDGTQTQTETQTETQTAEAEGVAATAVDEASEPVPVDNGGSFEDRRLAHTVRAELAADAFVRAHHYDVSARDGVVTLAPRVETPSMPDRAREIAARVEGVEEVVIDPAPPIAPGGSLEGSAEATSETASISDTSFEERFAGAIERGTPTDLERAFELPDPDREDYADQLATFHRAASGDRPRTYRVQGGDSLSIIAARTMGDGNLWQELYEYNRSVIGPNPNGLREGMELRIPQN